MSSVNFYILVIFSHYEMTNMPEKYLQKITFKRLPASTLRVLNANAGHLLVGFSSSSFLHTFSLLAPHSPLLFRASKSVLNKNCAVSPIFRCRFANAHSGRLSTYHIESSPPLLYIPFHFSLSPPPNRPFHSPLSYSSFQKFHTKRFTTFITSIPISLPSSL
jgi:hypothetical protein